MNHFTGISFNGVDANTDFKRLVSIQENYPFAEFGIILSKNWADNGNRYFNPAKLCELNKLSLNLSAHLCGRVAREAIKDNWKPAFELCGEYLGIFRRAQLNIAPYSNNPEKLQFSFIPNNFKEVIIQQKSPEKSELFLEYHNRTKDNRVVVLIDSSGGMGVEGNFIPISGFGKTGYAGGLNPDNIVKNTNAIFDKNGMAEPHDFWMDIESGVRTDDWFDLDKVEDICQKISVLLNR